jgi:hypothetical protein
MKIKLQVFYYRNLIIITFLINIASLNSNRKFIYYGYNFDRSTFQQEDEIIVLISCNNEVDKSKIISDYIIGNYSFHIIN